ncbi:DUF5715 family protein [Patescibacteria group bacterium]
MSIHLAFIVASTVFITQPTVITECAVKSNPTLMASQAELFHENKLAEACRLSRIKDRAHLEWFINEGLLVPLSYGGEEAYVIDTNLGEEDPDNAVLYVHVRPWVKVFVETVAERARTEIGARIRITSLVRPIDYQRRLREHNRNATSESTHATGSTIDISLVELEWREKNWLRQYILLLEKSGLVEATEERANQCLHIFVHPAFGLPSPVEGEISEPLKE